jgi:hypothetical protein
MAQTLSERKDTIFALLRTRCNNNIKGLEIADELMSLLLMEEGVQLKINDEEDYIGSADFHETHACMDAMKIKLIIKISNL